MNVEEYTATTKLNFIWSLEDVNTVHMISTHKGTRTVASYSLQH